MDILELCSCHENFSLVAWSVFLNELTVGEEAEQDISFGLSVAGPPFLSF
mgnify:FL=1